MIKGWYIADVKGVMKSHVFTIALEAKDECDSRNKRVRSSEPDYHGSVYHIEPCEIDMKD